MDSSLGNALVVVLSINLLLFLGQIAVLEINPDGNVFLDSSSDLFDDFDKGNYTLDSDYKNQLPDSNTVTESSGNLFTDTWNSVKGWLLDSTGIGYVMNILAAPYNFLKALHLPAEFAFALGTLWYGVTLFLIIAFIAGRN